MLVRRSKPQRGIRPTRQFGYIRGPAGGRETSDFAIVCNQSNAYSEPTYSASGEQQLEGVPGASMPWLCGAMASEQLDQ